MRKLLLALLLAIPAQAQEWNNACFGGLNDANSPATLGNCESQDLLNVEANLSGSAILKRKGFSNIASLTIATAPVTGSHSFIDSSGNRLDIVCQDMNCAKSTNGNAFSTFLTTAATGITRWSFVDQGGILYGANDKRDPIMKYDGTTRTSPVGMPLGSILELTQDRLVIGDISGQPNRVHFSSAGAYEQFTIGVNPEDSFFDDVGAAGDRIRVIKCVQGACFIFKTASITLYEMGDQYTTQGSVISGNIGMTDPAAIVTAGPDLYFRAQDKNYWRIGRSGLEQISKKIPNLVKSQSGGLGGGENSNTQTTKADWDVGVQNPLLSWNTATTNGSIFPSSTSFVDTSTANFALGSGEGAGVNPNGYVEFSGVTSTYVFRYDANVLPISDGWTLSGAPSQSVSGSSLTFTCLAENAGGTNAAYTKAFTGISGTTAMYVFRAAMTGTGTGVVLKLGIENGAEQFQANVRITETGISYVAGDSIVGTETLSQPAYSTYTIITSSGQKAYFYRNGIFKSSGTITTFTGNSNSARIACDITTEAGITSFVDFFHVSSGVVIPGASDIPLISTFTSRIFDTTFSTPTPGTFVSTQTLPTGTAVTYAVRVSSSPNNDQWDAYQELGATPGKPTMAVKRYWQYKITLKHANLTESPGITGTSLIVATTGQFVPQCIQPNSSISAWGTLSCAQTLVGNGSLVYYATSAATCAGLPSTPPVNAAGAAQSGWTAQTNNATVTIATNTAVYIGWRSLLGSATDQAQVDACVLAWNEGTPAQPSWAAYDSRKQAIYWTTTINGASATNRLLKYDLNLGEWFPWDIAAQAPKVINNELYFGGAAAGTWNKYGIVDSDNGSDIAAHYKTKDFGSDAPFLEKDFKSASILTRNNESGTLTGTWTNSIGATGSWTISLSTGSGITYARSLYALPKKSPQQFMNLKFSNDSATPFEILGISVKWIALPWKVQ